MAQKRLANFSIFSSLSRFSICNISFNQIIRSTHHVCVIGSGPAGFYAAQHLVKVRDTTHVDIYEKLPVPFGLVRYGVAPDHPEVKNVIHTFTNVLRNPKVTFIGNIDCGKDITFSQLAQHYNVILLCYGASEDRKLHIPGEDEFVLSGREFVGWYNGLPENRNLKISLQKKKRAVILGQGNVAIDIARILLSPIDFLTNTDISPYALEELKKSEIEEVVLCGRRGPIHAAFTIKEFRELLHLKGTRSFIDLKHFGGVDEEYIKSLPRPKKRLTDLLWNSAKASPQTVGEEPNPKRWHLEFFRSPLKVERANDKLQLTLGVNIMHPEDPHSDRVISTGQTEIDTCDIIFRSVGYKGRQIFSELPFDHEAGIVPNVKGKVQEGIYCGGWAGQGPRGVIVSTMVNSFDVAKRISKDLDSMPLGKTLGFKGVKEILNGKGKHVTSFDDYEKIAEVEMKEGRKVTTVDEMLKIANKT